MTGKKAIIGCIAFGVFLFSCSEEEELHPINTYEENAQKYLEEERLKQEEIRNAKADLIIEIFAQQFKWEARYSGFDGKLGKSNYLLIDSLNTTGIDYSDSAALDDFLATDAIHFPVDRNIRLVFRSKDVIHGAYFPHLKLQTNCVPGQRTILSFKPAQTTTEMREITENPNFNYILLCNKICGAGHFNMQKQVVIDREEDFLKWYLEQ